MQRNGSQGLAAWHDPNSILKHVRGGQPPPNTCKLFTCSQHRCAQTLASQAWLVCSFLQR
eukprot:1153119-Pelagomonas_calceolata.AAC.16